MIELCRDSIYKPLEMIFKSCLNQGIFPAESKKANVVPVHHVETGLSVCEKLLIRFFSSNV